MNHNVSSLSSFESCLNTTRFVDNFSFSEKQKNIINHPSILFIDEPIAINETLTPSLQETLKSLQGFLNNESITFNVLYKEYTKIIAQFSSNYIPYSFPEFINGLSMFELIFSNFNQNLLKISIQMTSEETISVYFTNEQESDSFSIYQNIISNQPSDSPSLMLNNMLFVFYIFSLCGKCAYNKLNQSNYIKNLNLYNKFYISHLNYGLLVQLGVMAYCNLTQSQLQLNKFRHYDNNIITTMANIQTATLTTTHWTKANNLSSNIIQIESKKKSRSNNGLICIDPESNPKIIPEVNMMLLDNQTHEVQWNDCVKVSICLNSFKWFVYESITNIYNSKINISIISPSEISNTFFGKKFEATFYSKAIEKSNLSIISKPILTKIIKAWPINQIIIKLELSNQLESIDTLFNLYTPFLIKTKEIHVKDSTNETEEYISIDTLFLEWSILETILSKMSSIKEDHNKKAQCSYSFLFNCWKMIINKSFSSKEINLYYNYSNIQEKSLFNFFTMNVNLSNFIKNIIKIISLLEEFKGYNTINIRLFQNNFRSKQLEFFLLVIINLITSYVVDKRLDNVININEKNFNYYIQSMQCYICDSSNNNKKHRLNGLKQTFFKIALSNKHFKFLSSYLTELSEVFNIVIFSDNPNSFKLIRTYEDNKIFFILSKADAHPKIPSTNELIYTTNPNEGIGIFKEFNMHIYVYLNNEKESYMQIFPLLHSIKGDKMKKCNVEITMICDKNYLEITVLIEHRYKKLVRYLSEDISNIYIISKTSVGNTQKKSNDINYNNNSSNSNSEYFNYDIYITSEKIKVITYAKYDFTNDPQHKRFLFSFISILSNCIEMILHILKNKDIFISQFVFVYKNSNDTTYLLYFKDGNLFIKKSYENNNLIRLNVRNAIPLFCILSKKKTTSYTMSNENFFDVFPRLFLNLNKVNDNKDNFNEVFFKKIHKNIFSDYYDNFFPICLSYEVFETFNLFFLSNDYLEISKGEIFDKGYLFAFDPIDSYNKRFDQMVIKQVVLFDSNIKMFSKEGEATYKYFTFSKLDHLIESLKEFVNKNTENNRKMLCYLHRKITHDHKRIVMNIARYIFNDRVRKCFIDQSIIKDKINQYLKDKVNRENDRVENRITQLTEAAKYENIIHKDKNCYLI